MIWVAVRVGLLALIAVTLTLRFRSIEYRDDTAISFDVGRSIEAMVRDRGYTLIENPVKPPGVLSVAIYFQRPDCPGKSVVVPFKLNYEALPLLNRVLPNPGYAHVFAYLGGTWLSQNRVLMFLEWMRQSALNFAGASDFVPVRTGLVFAEPSSCFESGRFDWRPVWDRSRNRALGNLSPTIQDQTE